MGAEEAAAEVVDEEGDGRRDLILTGIGETCYYGTEVKVSAGRTSRCFEEINKGFVGVFPV